MAIDWFGMQKRQEALKTALKREIEKELNATSQSYLQGWDSSDEKTGRDPRVSYQTLQSLYTRESWVRACIDVIQRTAISNGYRLLPAQGVNESKIQDREVAPILSLLERPNPNDTFSDIISEIIIDLHIYGDAYVEIVKDKTQGKPIALFNLYAPSIKVLVDKHGTVLGYLQQSLSLSRGGKDKPVLFKPDEVLHLKLPNPGSEVYGLSPLESLFLPIETDLWAQEYNKKFFQNHATPKLHVDLGECTLAQLKRTREYFASQLRGAANAHKTLITEGGAKINVIGVRPVDMEFLAQRKFSRDEICAVMGVPPMKIGISEDVNRASAAEHDKSFKAEKIIPLQRMIAKKLNHSLISLFNAQVEFHFVELDLRDAKEQAEIDKIEIEVGIKTIEEVRKQRGLPPNSDNMDEEEEETPPNDRVNDENPSSDSPETPKEENKGYDPRLIRKWRKGYIIQ